MLSFPWQLDSFPGQLEFLSYQKIRVTEKSQQEVLLAKEHLYNPISVVDTNSRGLVFTALPCQIKQAYFSIPIGLISRGKRMQIHWVKRAIPSSLDLMNNISHPV
jgi:hypothetical protein